MKDKAYKAGYIFGLTVCSCATIAIAALTIKLITWLF